METIENINSSIKSNGAAMAAMLSASIGCLIIGINIILAEISPVIKELLNWWNPAGPLSGKTGVGVIAWLILWLILHNKWKSRDTNVSKIIKISLIILAIAFLFSFPPFFEMFAGH